MSSAHSALVLIGKHVFVQPFKFTASGEEELEGGVLEEQEFCCFSLLMQ